MAAAFMRPLAGGIPVWLAEQAGSQWKAWCPYCVKYHLHGPVKVTC
jgi:hypothetical protein